MAVRQDDDVLMNSVARGVRRGKTSEGRKFWDKGTKDINVDKRAQKLPKYQTKHKIKDRKWRGRDHQFD